MASRNCVIEYAKRQALVDLSTLGFTPIKTTEQFQSNYEMHDLACQYAALEYLKRKFSLIPIGVDERGRRVMVKNSLPNYMAEKSNEVFCFDPKAKKRIENFGWVNERDAISYRELANACRIPVYVDFVQVVGGKLRGEIGHCNIEDEPSEKTRAWNGNPVWIYKWEKGLARI
jgi:hypothetical protein